MASICRLNEVLRLEPFLKWAGGKGHLISQYADYFPAEYTGYHEPFLGGGAVFFYLAPNCPCYLSDNNPELINVYTVVRDHVEELIKKLKQLEKEYYTLPEELRKQHFLEIRSKSFKDRISRAMRTIYLNKTCFNGLYRVNRKGQFNVPFGRYKNPTICDEQRLRAASGALQNKVIEIRDFRTTAASARAGDFVYFDPPYHPLSETANFTSYTDTGFNEQDQRDLAELARELSRSGCKVMISNSDTRFIREIYEGFRQIKIKARRSINCRPERRGIINELLILNY